MNLDLDEDRLLLRDAFARLLDGEATLDRARAAPDDGFDPDLWRSLVEAGAPLVRVPAEAGGLGLSLLDAALTAEEAGRHLASAPIVEAMVAARLIALCETGDAATADDAIVTLALTPAIDGICTGVPGGSAAAAVIALDGEDLVLVHGRQRAQDTANFGRLPVATWDVGGTRTVLASGARALVLHQQAAAEWKLLSAALLAGLARQALVAAADYAKERMQFGRPVGSFQGLAHPLADAVTEIEGARLLVWKAIAAIAEGDRDAAAMVSLCWWWAGQAGARALRQAIRMLGGYGLSLEYDLHLYHRRGSALILLGGSPDAELALAGDLLAGDARRALPDAGDVGISFGFGEATRAHAERVDAFFRANWDARMAAKGHHSSSSHDREFHRKLAETGLIFGGWPAEHGGLGHTAEDAFATTLAFEEWNYTSHIVTITNMVGQIVMRFGSDAARAEILPRIKAGEAVCSLGFSEPGAGSDVFAARTAAVRDGEDWIVEGQKMFTTGGHFADYVLLLARTTPGGAKHEGLTLFAVPTTLPGYAVQPVHTYQDERTNITFYSGMRVPDRYRLGEAGQGAAVMGAALSLEHGGGNYFSGQARLLRNLAQWAVAPGRDGMRPVDDGLVRMGLARIRARYEIAQAFVVRGFAGDAHADRSLGPMAKVFITESFLTSSWEALEMAGPDALATGSHPLGMIELDHRRAYGTTIYGGTSEVHRSIIAEQALGLPKSRS